MLDSLVTNAEAMHYVKFNLVLDLLVGFIIGVTLIRVIGIFIWDWSEPIRKPISKWWKKRKEHDETMEAIDRLN